MGNTLPVNYDSNNQIDETSRLKKALRNPVLGSRNNYQSHVSSNYIEKMEENRRRHHSTIRGSSGNDQYPSILVGGGSG